MLAFTPNTDPEELLGAAVVLLENRSVTPAAKIYLRESLDALKLAIHSYRGYLRNMELDSQDGIKTVPYRTQ